MATPSTKPHCPSCGTLIEPDTGGLAGGLCPRCLLADSLQSTVAGRPAEFDFPAIESIVDAFPDLEIIEMIGRGGMGVVYKARQKSLNRLVALKILPHSLAADPEFTQRFEGEAKALANLNHPNIVTVHEFGLRGDLYFLMMEFVDGPNLRVLLSDHRLEAEEALAIVPQLCDALEFAHQRQVVHCDIKPENLLLNTAGKVKIADFGIARILGQTGGESNKTAGTPAYMAPEQRDHPHVIDTRADIYSLGVVIYEMLTGERPGDKLMPPSGKNREVDVRLDEIVLRALEANPNSRWPSANALNSELRTFLNERLGEPKVTPPKKLPWSCAWMGRLAAALSIAGLLLYLGAITLPYLGLKDVSEPEKQAFIESFIQKKMEMRELDFKLDQVFQQRPRTAEGTKQIDSLDDQMIDKIRDLRWYPREIPHTQYPLLYQNEPVFLPAAASILLALIGIVLGLRHLSWLRGQQEPLPGEMAGLVACLFAPALLAALALRTTFFELVRMPSPIEPHLQSSLIFAVALLLVTWAARSLVARARNLRHAPPVRLPLLVSILLLGASCAIPLTYGHLVHRSNGGAIAEKHRDALIQTESALSAVEIDSEKEGGERYQADQLEAAKQSVLDGFDAHKRDFLHNAVPFPLSFSHDPELLEEMTHKHLGSWVFYNSGEQPEIIRILWPIILLLTLTSLLIFRPYRMK